MRRFITSALVLAAVIGAALSKQRADDAVLAVALEHARITADTNPALPARLTASRRSVPARLANLLPIPSDTSGRLTIAARLIRYAKAGTDDAMSAQAIGSGRLLAGFPEDAASAFARRPEEKRDASLWNDLAAAEIVAATSTKNHHRWLAALHAVNRALALDSGRAEARFNRAVILEGIGAIPVARQEWQSYLRIDSKSAWAGIARTRLRSLPASGREIWRSAVRRLAQVYDDELEQLILLSPEYARLNAEGPILAQWAEAMVTGDTAAAQRHLDVARVVAQRLHRNSGESLLAEAVSVIDAGRSSVTAARAHLAYRTGRIAYEHDDLITAERDLRRVADGFQRIGSPMAAVAMSYVAATIFDRNEIDRAEAILRSLLGNERALRSRHQALFARILHQLALCEAVRGHWSASLAAARESMAISRRLGERVNAAAAEAIVSEDYDFLGQPELARQHGMSSLDACAGEDLYRARVILAALSRTELRAGHWLWAGALIGVEQQLAKLYVHPRLDADMYMRRATALARSSGIGEALRTLEQAREAASRIRDDAMRSRFRSDIDAADGTIRRDTKPAEAIALLSSAIAFQRSATRPLLLPELLLQRGRAHRRLHRPADASRDFDDGIRELERQRTHVFEADLRPGLFDDAAELFEEAVDLQVLQGDARGALAYVERGRARTMLEEMEGLEIQPLSVGEMQRHLDIGTAMVEYMFAGNRLVIFTITRDEIRARSIPVSRRQVTAAASSFLGALTAPATPPSLRHAAAALHDILVAPVAGDIRSMRLVVFVPDNTLQRIPFGALVDRQHGTYLVQQHLLTTAPSASVYVAAEQHARRLPLRQAPAVAVFANPTIPRDEYPSLPSLEGAEREARFVRASYKTGMLLTRDEATAVRFLETAPRFDAVHFGGHALTNERDPSASALVCAASPPSRGSLTTRMIARAQFRKTRVVVLAACSTMAGRNAAIEGVPHMAHAFLVAGVPSVVGTLWDIDDRDSAFVVRAIHTHLGHAVSPAVALREAQLAAIHSRVAEEREPRRWAAFMVTGAAGELEEGHSTRTGALHH